MILELIGSGGMGCVYRAQQRALGRTVAVKVIPQHLLHDSCIGARFFIEAQAASRLSHPNVVGIIDFGTTDDGMPYLVMEYLRGETLKAILEREGALPPHRVICIARQVLTALAEAHALGIVHRDLKPSNIVLEPTRTGEDLLKVVDFGLAKFAFGSSQNALSVAGTVHGTPAYMAPEQATGGAIDGRTDLYAVCVMLFELLTGRVPFQANSAAQLLSLQVNAPPPDPRNVPDGRPVPDPLAKVIMQGLAKSAEQRYQTAEALSTALTQAEQEMLEWARPTIPVPCQAGVCVACGDALSSSQKFCGGCGEAISSHSPQNLRSEFPAAHPTTGVRRGRRSACLQLRVEGADDDLAWLQSVRLTHAEALLAVRLVGRPGAGKTTVLREFLSLVRSSGDVVALGVPDPWGARPAYWCLQRLIRQLAQLEDGQLPWAYDDIWPVAQQGLRMIFGTTYTLVDSPRMAAREAFRWAAQRAAMHSLTGRVVVGLDDLDCFDSASRNAIADALHAPCELTWMVVATHVPHFMPLWGDSIERVLQGFPAERLPQLLGAAGVDVEPALAQLEVSRVAPLWVEQVIRLQTECPAAVAPPGLGDTIARRVEALPPEAQSVARVLAVLGDGATLKQLQMVYDEEGDIDRGLFALATRGMVEREGEGLRWGHPFFREVVLSLTPPATRAALYSRMADDFGDELPLEAQALFAANADRYLEALFLLEQVIATSHQRDDSEAAIDALEQAYDTAKHALRSGVFDNAANAIDIFGRKLVQALVHSGQLAKAETLLREVLDLSGSANQDHVQILQGLAVAARDSARPLEADRLLGEAIHQARRSGWTEAVSSLEQLKRQWAC